MNNAEMANMLMMVFTIAIIVTFVVAVGLFFLLIFMRKPKSGVRLFSINDRQELAGNEETYFSYIKYDQEKYCQNLHHRRRNLCIQGSIQRFCLCC